MMRWNLHGLIIHGETTNSGIREHWEKSFASCPAATGAPAVSFDLNTSAAVPSSPPGEPSFRQGDLLAYYLDGRTVVAHFPRFGQLRLDLDQSTTEGWIVPAALTTYGVFEDLVAIGLSPHLRRRRLFLIHAFAAARPRADSLAAALLVGSIGSGKTTSGMALLNAGWKLLSNDSPILNASSEVLSYPGLLSAYADTFARFEATSSLAQQASTLDGRPKLSVAAESIWSDVWADFASASAILFPQIESGDDHAAYPVAPPEALRRLLPHAVEQWDREMIPEHLRILRNLVESAPAYVLRLSPHVDRLPAAIARLVS